MLDQPASAPTSVGTAPPISVRVTSADPSPASQPQPARRRGWLLPLLILATLTALALYALQLTGRLRLPWLAQPPTPVATSAATADTAPSASTTAAASAVPTVAATARTAKAAATEARAAGADARVAALEARMAGIMDDAERAGQQADRAERLLLAAATREAIAQGRPLGPLADALETRFGRSAAQAVTILSARGTKVETTESLRQALVALTPALTGSPTPTQSAWERFKTRMTQIVVLRRADAPERKGAEALGTALRALDNGQAAVAAQTLAPLANVPGVQAWVARAEELGRVQAAVTAIDRAALFDSAAMTAPQAAPVRVDTDDALSASD